MLDNLRDYKVVLASGSPRRRELLGGLDIPFEVKTIDGVEESYPPSLSPFDVAQYIAIEKASAYRCIMHEDELIITADTIVIIGDEVLGKPLDTEDARLMLRKLSGRTHHVVTGVCIMTRHEQRNFSVRTDVTFAPLSDDDIEYYVAKYKPFDKAGSYGVQEWIGYVGVTGMNGSYYNVMGFPVQRVYEELKLIKPMKNTNKI